MDAKRKDLEFSFRMVTASMDGGWWWMVVDGGWWIWWMVDLVVDLHWLEEQNHCRGCFWDVFWIHQCLISVNQTKKEILPGAFNSD